LFHKYFPDDLLTMEQRNANTEGSDLPLNAVKSVDDVMALIESTINGVRAGTISVQAAANVSRLAALALKGIEVGELDKKMDLVNSVINDRKMKTKK